MTLIFFRRGSRAVAGRSFGGPHPHACRQESRGSSVPGRRSDRFRASDPRISLGEPASPGARSAESHGSVRFARHTPDCVSEASGTNPRCAVESTESILPLPITIGLQLREPAPTGSVGRTRLCTIGCPRARETQPEWTCGVKFTRRLVGNIFGVQAHKAAGGGRHFMASLESSNFVSQGMTTLLPRSCARHVGLYLLAAAILGFAVTALGTASAANTETTFRASATPRPRDMCIECDKPIGPGDRVYLINGQRIAVHAGACELAFERNPEKYLAKVKPQGNQFMDADSGGSARSWRWLAFGVYALAGLVFGGLCGYEAVNRGFRPLPWFLAGLFFNVFGFLVFLSRPAGVASTGPSTPGLTKVPVTRAPQPCPRCGTPNHPSAAACSACGAVLEPSVTSEVARIGMNR